MRRARDEVPLRESGVSFGSDDGDSVGVRERSTEDTRPGRMLRREKGVES